MRKKILADYVVIVVEPDDYAPRKWQISISTYDSDGGFRDESVGELYGLTKREAIYSAKEWAANWMWQKEAKRAQILLRAKPNADTTKLLELVYAPRRKPYPWVEL